MSNVPTNQDEMNQSISNAVMGSSGDRKYVIPTLYTKYEIENMVSSQRVLFRAALANMIEPLEISALAPPNLPSTTPLGQTDYYWSKVLPDFNTLTLHIQTIAGRRR